MSDEPKTSPPTNRKKLVLLLGGVVVVLGGAAGLWATGHLGGNAEVDENGATAANQGEASADDAGGPSPNNGHGAVAVEGATAVSGAMSGEAGASVITNLGSFTVNLRGSGGGRVLRMEVQLDSDPNTATIVGARGPRFRDSVITAVSDYTWSELEGVDGKTRLRDELLTRLNGISAPHVVDHLYFTQFVVQ